MRPRILQDTASFLRAGCEARGAAPERTKERAKRPGITRIAHANSRLQGATAQIWSEQVRRRTGGLVSGTSRRATAPDRRRSRTASSCPGSRQSTDGATTDAAGEELVGEASTPIVRTSQQPVAGPRMAQSVVSGARDCGQQHVRRTTSSYRQRNSSLPCAQPAKSSAGSISSADKRRRNELDMLAQGCWLRSGLSTNGASRMLVSDDSAPKNAGLGTSR